MPNLSRWPHADALLDRALGLPSEARPAFIREAAGDDAELAAALLAVLAEQDTHDGFLDPGGALKGALAGHLARSLDTDLEAMRLQVGHTVGGYEVVGVLGQGGMGEVYRARDRRLHRDVALKVLPHRFAADQGRRDRFEREARLLASLNDPHIAAIYEIEEDLEMVALVLELVEGPTLAERLGRGRIPIGEALDIAEQIARALVTAHERGIVHRDLKPANIKLTAGGDVKVLDFGIATALRDDATPGADGPTAEIPGAVLGTASYMAPERARGRRTDHRADIWAFGCVLFEMLTGAKAFDGDSPTSILARVLERDPEFSRLPVRTPASIIRLLERTLRKDPDKRIGYIGDALLDLDDARAELQGTISAPVPRAYQQRWAVLTSLALVAGLVAGAAAVWTRFGPAAPIVAHLAVPIPAEDNLVAGELPGLAISPDGRTVVYRARRDGLIHLVRRGLDEDAAILIDDSVNGASPFFSPDGAWIGFASESQLLKVPAQGGKPVVVCDAPGGARASWGSDDTIWFTAGTNRVVYRVAASGGTPEAATALRAADGDQAHEGPSVFPDGRRVLVGIIREGESFVGVARAGSDQVRVLTAGRQPLALADGWLLFRRENALWSARLDLRTLDLVTEPALALEGLEIGSVGDTAHFGVSAGGTLVYMPRQATDDDRRPVWVDRDGTEEVIPAEPRPYTRASLSPDGNRIALASASPENRDVWVYEIGRQTLMRLTLNPATDTAPIWSPDGRRIAFRSDRDGGGIFIMPADGADTADRLTRPDGPAHTPYAFTPDGRTVIFVELRSYIDQGISAVSVGPSPEVTTLLDGRYAETRPALSPDGRWLAYQSDESGRYEIYARPYPNVTDSRIQVSTAGGTSAHWSPGGSELFFFDGTSLVSAAVHGGRSISFDPPVALFNAARFDERLGPLYDVAPDGRRFLFLRRTGALGDAARRDDLFLVTNWTSLVTGR